MPRAVTFFDVDGTLVPTTSSSQHVAKLLGNEAALRRAEDDYAAGRTDNFAVSVLDAAAWRGWMEHDVESWLDSLPLVDGIADVVTWCNEHDAVPALATLAWQPVGAYLCKRFGFATACGPRLAVRAGRYSGEVAEHLSEFGKRDFAVRLAANIGVQLADCTAVGDSRSDVPLFSVVGYSVAFNASDAVKRVATAVVDGDDLRQVLPLLEAALARSAG